MAFPAEFDGLRATYEQNAFAELLKHKLGEMTETSVHKSLTLTPR
jgi:hypothetical protein